MIKNSILVFIFLLLNGIRLDAQVQPVAIDRIDVFENVWSKGYNVKRLDSLIVGVGSARRSGLSQGMHISSYSFDGEILHSAFVYDSINGYSVTPNDIHDIADMGNNRFFTCTHGGGEDKCYAYDAVDQSFIFIDTIATNYEVDFSFVYAIKQYEDDIYVLSLVDINDERRLGVLKYSKDTVTYDVFGDLSPHWNHGELIVTGEDEWSVTYWHSGVNKSYLFRKKDGNIKNIGVISEPLQKGPIRSALIHENDEVIYTANLNKYDTGSWIPSWMIVRIDSLGKTLWVIDLEDFVNLEIDPIVASGNTQIPTIINAVDDDGVIFVGYDYEFIDTLKIGRGVIGKVSYNGELQWVRKYRHITEDGYRNQFYDIDYDGFGGYIVYGTIRAPNLEPFSSAAWLMRLDSEGFPIDTTTAVIEVTSILETVHPYPNPGEAYLTFDIYKLSAQDKIPISLYTKEGRLVEESTIDSGTLSISHLHSGLYYFKYEIEGTLYSGKFIRQ